MTITTYSQHIAGLRCKAANRNRTPRRYGYVAAVQVQRPNNDSLAYVYCSLISTDPLFYTKDALKPANIKGDK